MWIHQEVAKIMGIAVKELEEDGQFGLVYQSFLGFEIRNNSLHFKNFWHWLTKNNKYVSKTMEFELELFFFDVLLLLLACFFVEWMHSWLLLSTFCTNLFRWDQVGA